MQVKGFGGRGEAAGTSYLRCRRAPHLRHLPGPPPAPAPTSHFPAQGPSASAWGPRPFLKTHEMPVTRSASALGQPLAMTPGGLSRVLRIPPCQGALKASLSGDPVPNWLRERESEMSNRAPLMFKKKNFRTWSEETAHY